MRPAARVCTLLCALCMILKVLSIISWVILSRSKSLPLAACFAAQPPHSHAPGAPRSQSPAGA